jgi:cytochrome P450 family 3 subfamily A
LILNATNPDTNEEKKLTDDEVVAQCIIFLLAGYETSSTTLSMVCYHLATNPDIQEKLQEEIDSVWIDEDKMPSYETVHELPYLDMVLSETLRLCPPG